MLNNYFPVGLILICLGYSTFGVRAGVSIARTDSVVVPHFQGMSNRQIESAVARVKKQRAIVVADLLIQLRDPGLKNRPEAAIIHLLGRIRSVDSVPALLHRIIFRSTLPPATFRLADVRGIIGAWGWGTRPAVNALISIGMPSVRAILKLLPHEANALRRRLMVRVLVGVEGRAVTRFRLRRAIKNAPNLQIRTNLEAALKDAAVPHPKKIDRHP